MCMTENAPAAGKPVNEDAAAETACHGEHNGQHDNQSGVEEDGESEDQRGHTERKRGPLFTELSNQEIREHFGAAACLNQSSEHRAQAHEQRDRCKC